MKSVTRRSFLRRLRSVRYINISNIKTHAIKQASCLDKFVCAGAECIDSCCRGWEMQLSPEHQRKFQKEAPELLDTVTRLGNDIIMKRDKVTGDCNQYNNGLCKIHKQYGEEFLGDACYFYPRVIRQFQSTYMMTASLSCPEIAKSVLFGRDGPFSLSQTEITRLPFILDDYCPNDMSSEEALSLIEKSIMLVKQGNESSIAMMRLVLMSYALEELPVKKWKKLLPVLWKDTLIHMPTEYAKDEDGGLLLAALASLIASSKQTLPPRLKRMLEQCEDVFNITIDCNRGEVVSRASDRRNFSLMKRILSDRDQSEKIALEPVLLRWMESQLCTASFPLAGFGGSPIAVSTIIAVRYATVRLLLTAATHYKQEALTEEEIVDIIQPLSRFMDHLGDPTLSLSIYRDAGWLNLSRMRGLIEG